MSQKLRTLRPAHMRHFAQSLQDQELAPGTLEKYLRDVRAFAAWLNARETAAWKAHLCARRYAPVTANSMLAALNSLFRFLGWEDCRVKALKIQRRLFRDESRDLSRAEYDRLLRTARRLGQDRLALVMETICSTVEAVRRGRADIALKGKIRTILLPGKLCRKLLQYAREQKTASGAIFRTRSGSPLNRRQIWAAMKRLCEQAGVASSKVFPHNLRHLFAATFYRVNKDLTQLADLLGHSSIETTRIYLVSSGAEHSRQLERLGLIL